MNNINAFSGGSSAAYPEIHWRVAYVKKQQKKINVPV